MWSSRSHPQEEGFGTYAIPAIYKARLTLKIPAMCIENHLFKICIVLTTNFKTKVKSKYRVSGPVNHGFPNDRHDLDFA